MNLDDEQNYIRGINRFIIMFSLLEYGNEYMIEVCNDKYTTFGLVELIDLYNTGNN